MIYDNWFVAQYIAPTALVRNERSWFEKKGNFFTVRDITPKRIINNIAPESILLTSVMSFRMARRVNHLREQWFQSKTESISTEIWNDQIKINR